MGAGAARRSRAGRIGTEVLRGAFALLLFIVVLLVVGRVASGLREHETPPPQGTVALADLAKENP